MKTERTRAFLPKGYVGSGGQTELLGWNYVDERMRSAKHYWLSTMSPDGAPHTRPVGGMWLDRRLYLGGSPESRWAQNVASNPSVCLSLSESEESDRAVIVHGKISVRQADRDLSARLVSVSNEKYGYGQTIEQYEGQPILELVPEIVLAWTDLANATRWRTSE
jgi:general stress protein 26